MERLTNDNHNTPPREGRIKQFFDGLVHFLGGISRIVWISILGIVIIGALSLAASPLASTTPTKTIKWK